MIGDKRILTCLRDTKQKSLAEGECCKWARMRRVNFIDSNLQVIARLLLYKLWEYLKAKIWWWNISHEWLLSWSRPYRQMENISGSYIALIQDRDCGLDHNSYWRGEKPHQQWLPEERAEHAKLMRSKSDDRYSLSHGRVALQLRSHLSYSQGKYTASHTHLSMQLEGFHLPSTPCKVLMGMTLCFTMMKTMKIEVNSWKLNSKNVCCFPFRSLLRYKNVLHVVFITQCKKMCKPKMNVWFWQQCLQNHSSTENSRSIS